LATRQPVIMDMYLTTSRAVHSQKVQYPYVQARGIPSGENDFQAVAIEKHPFVDTTSYNTQFNHPDSRTAQIPNNVGVSSRKESTGYNRNSTESVLPTEVSHAALANTTEYSGTYRQIQQRPVVSGMGATKGAPRMEANGYTKNDKYQPDQLGWRNMRTTARNIAHLPEHLRQERISRDFYNYHGLENESVSKTDFSFRGGPTGVEGECDVTTGAPIVRPAAYTQVALTSQVAGHQSSGFCRSETHPYDGVGTLSMQLLGHGYDPEAQDLDRVAASHTGKQLNQSKRQDPAEFRYMLRNQPAMLSTSELLMGKDPHSFSKALPPAEVYAAARSGAAINPLVLNGQSAGKPSQMDNIKTGKDAGSAAAAGVSTGTLAGISGFPADSTATAGGATMSREQRSRTRADELGTYRSTYQEYCQPALHNPVYTTLSNSRW
jgi:hypothetical protein